MKTKLNLALRRSLYACYTFATLAVATTMNFAHAQQTFTFKGTEFNGYRTGSWTDFTHWTINPASPVPSIPRDGSAVIFNQKGEVENAAAQSLASLYLATVKDDEEFIIRSHEDALKQIVAVQVNRGTLSINYAGAGDRTFYTVQNSGRIIVKKTDLTIFTGVYSPYEVSHIHERLDNGKITLDAGRTLTLLGLAQDQTIGDLVAGTLHVENGKVTIQNSLNRNINLVTENEGEIASLKFIDVKNVTNNGTIRAASIAINGTLSSTGTLIASQHILFQSSDHNQSVDSLTTASIGVRYGTVTINDFTSPSADVRTEFGGKVIFNNSVTVGYLLGDDTGILQTKNKNLTINGRIDEAGIDLGTGTLSVNQDYDLHDIFSLKAGNLTINAGTVTIGMITTDSMDLNIAADARVILKDSEMIKNVSNTGTIQTKNKNLQITGSISGADFDLGTGSITVNNDIANRLIDSIRAGSITVHTGALSINDLVNDSTDFYIAGSGRVILNNHETIKNLVNTGAVKSENKNLTITGTIAGADIDLGTGALTVNNDIDNRLIDSLTARLLDLNTGTVSVNSITSDTTDLDIEAGATVILNNEETIKDLFNTGKVKSENKNLTITGVIAGADIDLDTATLSVNNDISNRSIGSLTAGNLSLNTGALSINHIMSDSTDINFAARTRIIFNNDETIRNLLGLGTVATENKNLTVTGGISGADIDLDTATLSVNNDILNRSINSLTVGTLALGAGTLSVNSITSDSANLSISTGARVVLNNDEVIKNILGSGTVKSENKNLTVTGTISGANIDLGTGNLSVNNNIADRNIGSLTAESLSLSVGMLSINHIISDSIDLNIAGGTKIILNNDETIKNLLKTGAVKTENKNLTVTGSIAGAEVDLGTGTLSVNNNTANHVVTSLKAGGLIVKENVNLSLQGKGTIGNIKGATQSGVTVMSGASYNLTSANDTTLTVEGNAEVSIIDNLLIASKSELTKVTLNINANGKVQSNASYLGTGNEINNSGTLILKGGTLNNDISNPAPFADTGSSSQIIIEGTVISTNAIINTSLIKFSITDSSVYDRLYLQGVDSALNTAGILLDISNYTLTDGDTFTLVNSDSDLTTMMGGVMLNFEGKHLRSEGFSYNIINTGTQWRVNFHVVPEPSTATLSLLALAGLLARRRRKAA